MNFNSFVYLIKQNLNVYGGFCSVNVMPSIMHEKHVLDGTGVVSFVKCD